MYIALTKGKAMPCQNLARRDILDDAECKLAAISLRLVDSKILVARQSELDRPFGCRVQGHGGLWINTKQNSPMVPTEYHQVICKMPPGKFNIPFLSWFSFGD